MAYESDGLEFDLIDGIMYYVSGIVTSMRIASIDSDGNYIFFLKVDSTYSNNNPYKQKITIQEFELKVNFKIWRWLVSHHDRISFR